MFGLWLCKVFWICEQGNKYATVLFLTLLSLDRYAAVCVPMHSMEIRTRKTAYFASLACWMCVILALIPVLAHTEQAPYDNRTNRVQCLIKWTSDYDQIVNQSSAGPVMWPIHVKSVPIFGNESRSVNASASSTWLHDSNNAEKQSNKWNTTKTTATTNNTTKAKASSWERSYMLTAFTILFLVPALVMSYCCVKVWRRLVHTSKQRNQLCQHFPHQKTRRVRQPRVHVYPEL